MMRSQLEPMKKLVKTLRHHEDFLIYHSSFALGVKHASAAFMHDPATFHCFPVIL